MEQVSFAGLLAQMGLNGPQQAAYRWLQAHSVIDFDYERMGAMALYRASDRLYRDRDRLKRQLSCAYL